MIGKYSKLFITPTSPLFLSDSSFKPLHPVNNSHLTVMDRVEKMLCGQKILLTGGKKSRINKKLKKLKSPLVTGFMGKVFLEQLLRITKEEVIFILIRNKKNLSIFERFMKVLNSPVSELPEIWTNCLTISFPAF